MSFKFEPHTGRSKGKAKKTIKAAIGQILTGGNVKENMAKVVPMIRQAKKLDCDVILFHEGCLNGYITDNESLLPAVRKAEKEVQKLAKRLKMAILIGSISKEDGKIYNDLLIIDETGTILGRYAKTWRAGEPNCAAGSGPVIFRVAGIDCTAIICHDLRYPELPRLAVAAGAKIIFIANNESGVAAENKLLGYRSMQISRATENGVYSIMANPPADPKDVADGHCSHGNSKIVDPMGNIIDEAGSFEERLVIGELAASGLKGSAQRILGQRKDLRDLYGVKYEHPEYAAWLEDGVKKLVRRLDGKTNLR